MTPGTRLGSYEIAGSIGAGGMGEVFRARDRRLERDVAVKVLSPAFARHPDALARFEREALSIAKLSHPNIVSIYEFGHHNEITYVVTELVDGDTLRARLANGPLAARRAVGYAQQIARGIAAAHARGIVHRDLKPENVMITHDDHVKILDFGLAKPVAAPEADETLALSLNTSAGTVLGTFGYMAPEQVRGLTVDHRADIFSFGAVLYEMITGERAFKGETAADTMTAILTKDPPDLDLSKLAIPPALDRIIRRCLEKTPGLRFQSANDLAFALETLSTASGTTASGVSLPVGEAAPAPRARVPWTPWAITALAVSAALVAWLFRPPAPRDVWKHFSQITDFAGEETAPSISPDGTMVAYAMRRNGRWGIYAQRVGGRNATPIVADPAQDFGGPRYSPDGTSIAFHEADADGGIFIAGATGESVRRLTETGFDPAWSPDGKSLAFTTEQVADPSSRQAASHLLVVDVDGGTPRQLSRDGEDAVQPAWSPSGQRIVYWSNTGGQRDIYTIPAGGGARAAVTSDTALDWSPEWSPDGRYIYFSSDRGGAMNLWRVPVTERTGAPKGDPEPVTNGVQASAALERFSRSGTRMVFRSSVRSINPVAIPFDPSTGATGAAVVLDGSNNVRIPSDVSPDGTQLALFSIGERQEDLFISAVGSPGHMRRLTDDPWRERAPMFTRDGKALVFHSDRGGDWAAWFIHADGSGLRKIGSAPHGVAYVVPSPVGDEVVFTSADDPVVYRGTLDGKAPPSRLPNTSANGAGLVVTRWSPDGRALAGAMLSRSGRWSGVGVYDLRAQTLTVLSNDETTGVEWLPDSRRLLYFTDNGARLVLMDSVTRKRTGVPVHLPGRSTDDVFGVTRDGRTIYYGAVHAEADIWIADRE